MIKPNILLIDESPIYGGHETMFMAFIKAILPQLLKVANVDFVVNSRNKRLISQLKQSEFGSINVHKVTLSTLPIKPITQFLINNDKAKIRSIINNKKPKYVLNIQGTIEIGCTSLWVCKSLNIPVITYLPITKSSANLGVTLGRLRDIVCRKLYYSIPKKIITISRTNQDELQNLFFIPPERVTVIHNFVDIDDRNRIKNLPEFSSQKKHLALIGRISNVQKRQFDFLKKWLASKISHNYVIHVVGDSDDCESQDLKKLCSQAILNDNIIFHGWKSADYVSAVITQCDALLLPSRFEGVPLVMIEAISSGCKVIGSRVDGMKEFLPIEWTFDTDDWESMFNIIEKSEKELNSKLLEKVQESFKVFNKNTNTDKFLSTLMEEL
ncbi:glycosyltransferase [Pseudocolwellia sp. HL-MZ19]|uniref:glycosyltransferase n=1 Tax=Pseudocolwellia sp. HL-MZ19 TaxID=3400846 RepID=UPI003CFA1B0F